MKRKKIKKFPGVYYRESTIRNFQGRPDRCFDIAYKNLNNKLIWEKVGWVSEGYTAALASQVRSERIRTIRHGEELPRKKKKNEKKFHELWEIYYEYAKANKKSYKDDDYRYKKHIEPVFGQRDVSEINIEELDKFKTILLKDKGLSAQTTKHTLGLLRSIFNRAHEQGCYSGENPVSKIKLPSTNNTNRLRYLTKNEAELLLLNLRASSQTIYEIAYVSLYTGMRADEIFSLRWQDLDLRNNVIHILETKNTESRTAYITGELKNIFTGRKKGKASDLIFPQELKRGNRKKTRGNIKKNQIGNTYRRTVERLNLNEGIKDPRYRVCFHTLRHTFGSWLAIKGISLYTIKELMGHKRISQTMRYAHLCPDVKRKAVEELHK